MTTTTVIAEILVVGSMTAVWLVMLVERLFKPFLMPFLKYLSGWPAGEGMVIVGVLVVIYQLGWFMNWFSYELVGKAYGRKLKREFFGNLERSYERMQAEVLQGASAALVTNIRVELSVVRMARAAVINLTAISILVGIGGNPGAAVLLLGFASLALVHTCGEMRDYYRHIREAWEVLHASAKAV